MSYFSELALSRRSIRKFEDKDIPQEDIEEIIRIATSAPSGCNSQCWKFVVVKDRNVIEQLKEAVIKKTEELFNISDPNESQELGCTPEYLNSRHRMSTFFVNAPVVIAVFMTEMCYFDGTYVSILQNQGYTGQSFSELLAHPDLLSIGAAIQNLLLAAHEKGYGACWMNDPAIAAEEIGKILGVPPPGRFISLIPMGYPAYTPRGKKMKDFNEICTII